MFIYDLRFLVFRFETVSSICGSVNVEYLKYDFVVVSLQIKWYFLKQSIDEYVFWSPSTGSFSCSNKLLNYVTRYGLNGMDLEAVQHFREVPRSMADSWIYVSECRLNFIFFSLTEKRSKYTNMYTREVLFFREWSPHTVRFAFSVLCTVSSLISLGIQEDSVSPESIWRALNPYFILQS